MAKDEVEKLMTPREAASVLGVSVQTLANWRATRLVDLPFIKLGGKHVRYRPSAVNAWLDANSVAS